MLVSAFHVDYLIFRMSSYKACKFSYYVILVLLWLILFLWPPLGKKRSSNLIESTVELFWKILSLAQHIATLTLYHWNKTSCKITSLVFRLKTIRAIYFPHTADLLKKLRSLFFPVSCKRVSIGEKVVKDCVNCSLKKCVFLRVNTCHSLIVKLLGKLH